MHCTRHRKLDVNVLVVEEAHQVLDGLFQPFARLLKAGLALCSVEEGLELALVLSDT